MDYGTTVRLASFQLEIGRKDFGQLAGWVQRIDFGLGAGANPNAQIGYPTRSPPNVSRASILRIGIVRVLQPGQFEPGTCQVRAWNLSSAQKRREASRPLSFEVQFASGVAQASLFATVLGRRR